MYNYPGFGMPQQTEIPQVQGLAGAQAFNMAPNSSVLLLDQTEPIVWVVKTDSTGVKIVCAPYDMTPHVTPQPVTANDLQSIVDRLVKIEERLGAYESNSGNAVSNGRAAKSGRPDSESTKSC